MRPRWLVFGSVLALVASTELALAQPSEADAHLERGLGLYANKDYAGAIGEFQAGYAIDPKPELLYTLAQAERMNGDCKTAIEHYEAFLATKPSPEREAAALANVQRCKAALPSEAPSAPPVVEPHPAAAPPRPAPKPRRKSAAPPQSAPFYTDVVGDVLAGAGLVGLGVGTAYYISSIQNENRAEENADGKGSDDYGMHEARVERAESQRTRGVIFGSIGLAFVAGGVTSWLLHGRANEATSISVTTGSRSLGFAYGSAF